MKRLLSVSTNPAGFMAAVGAVYAVIAMIVNATHHQGVIDPKVIVAGVGTLLAFFTRQVVTPVADPKDLNGKPLVPAPLPAAPSNVKVGPVFVGEQGPELHPPTPPAAS